MALSVDLVQVAATSRGWDDQNLRIRTAHEALSATPAGFTPRVQGEAQAFLAAWLPVTLQLLVACESHADGLRRAAGEIVGADFGIAHGIAAWVAGALLREER